MKMLKYILMCVLGLAWSMTSLADDLSDRFIRVPDDQRIAVYWYWMSDNISTVGVERDLEAMKKAGITRAFIGNIWQDEVAAGDVKMLSPQWWGVMHAALKRASQLGIEIGIFNSPGWSQSGGPWVQPNQAMRYLAHTETMVTGTGQEQTIKFPALGEDAQDVKVLALPVATPVNSHAVQLTKKTGQDLVENVHLDRPMTLRSITFETENYLLADVAVQYLVNGQFQTMRQVHLDRTNTALNTGFNAFAPVCLSLPDVKAQDVRLLVTGGPQDCSFTATLSDEPKVERYEEKSLAKMYQYPLPMWGEYMWNTQAEPVGTKVVQPGQVVDVTQYLQPDGTLKWRAPRGQWKVMRTAMMPTGVTNSPASWEATGLEVDKMSKEHVASHFDAFIGELLRRIPAKDRTCFRVVVEDSYETGGQNWTDDMIASFKKTYGYDPVPFIPVLYGQVIGSQDQSERFLWDLRRLVADRVARDYVGGLRDVSHRHGLTTWLECYGHWGFPSEFLMYGGQSDEVGGEFWSEGDLGNIENRAASSCAHIYGKQKVWAESCTAGGPNFSRYPAVMKQRTDRFFCEGINATLLHLFIQQPDESTFPGVSAPFGNDFQRKNVWWQQIDLFTDYLRRCNLMLQQGEYVADVAYFIGEDCPKMTGECNPAVPRGYSFDYINAEVLQQATVQGGVLCLPSGMQYRVLVLPDQTTMRPEMMNCIGNLVQRGLPVVGPRPVTSPSMKDYPMADYMVRQIAASMWETGQYGLGRVYPKDTDLSALLQRLGAKPDCYIDPALPAQFIHRRLQGRDIYFISNQSDAPLTVTPRFHITGRHAEWWDPVTARQMQLPDAQDDGEFTTLTLNLAPNESAFVVFSMVKNVDKPLPVPVNMEEVMRLETPWKVAFQAEMRGPQKVQTWEKLHPLNEDENPDIRYYSGLTSYTHLFRLEEVPEGPLYLDLGKVMVMAKVYVNDKYVGGLWTPPYRLCVTDFLQKGKNKVRVDVVNNWQNRLIGDQQLPIADRPTWTSVNPWKADSPLQESGLLGPVRLMR